MEKVIGIGGIFFKAKDPKALAKWYEEHLGVTPNAWLTEGGKMAFAPFPSTTKYFGSDTQTFMVNFRVRDLEKLAEQLRAAGIEVKIDPEASEYGRFARIHDPEGNPIELWQPKA
jgi:predicted enzyme related to lactoylglutathione lyase